MIRSALRFLIEVGLSINVLKFEVAASCSELLAKLKKEKYTHLILDLFLSDGSSLEILSAIRQLYPELRIAILTMASPEIYKKAGEGCGVFYFCSKVAPEEEQISILRRFFNDTGLPLTITKESRDFNPFADLAPRELEVLHYILKGVGTKEIADVLNVKPNTVSTVKRKIFEKTNTSNIVKLSELASLYLGRVPY